MIKTAKGPVQKQQAMVWDEKDIGTSLDSWTPATSHVWKGNWKLVLLAHYSGLITNKGLYLAATGNVLIDSFLPCVQRKRGGKTISMFI